MTKFTQERKDELLARIARHEAADTIAKGAYAEVDDDGHLRVCAVGCAMVETGDDPPHVSDWHEAMKEMWGIPAWLGKLEDKIFESLPHDQAMTWPRRFVEAVPVDVVLGHKLAHKMSSRRLRETVLPLAPSWPEDLRSQVTNAVQGMIDALDDDGDIESKSAAKSAESAARSAESAWSAWSAARSAARSAESAWSAESARVIAILAEYGETAIKIEEKA